MVWAQMIHAPVSLRETIQIVHNIKRYASGNLAGQGVVHSLRNGFITFSECGKSFRTVSLVFSSYSMTWEKRGTCSNVKEM